MDSLFEQGEIGRNRRAHPSSIFLVGVEAPKPSRRNHEALVQGGLLRMRLDRPLVFILVSFNREAEIGSALETAMEAIWIGGMTFFGLGALILEDQ